MARTDLSRSWMGRSARVARLGARVGGTYAGTAARKVFASTERRIELDERRRLSTAQQVADEIKAAAAVRAIRAVIAAEVIEEEAAQEAVAALVTAEIIEEEAAEEALATVLAAEETEAEAG